ncbi:DUF192 domain-containing protein [Natrinema salaciae]|uniref:Uncharacterized conserved membrane protein, UPF0127 family n=1 Tax=Natrinema salaciae TaxID=1186196 RepID=A0A1H9PP68_9EURY|nr:DUF192 domain-containing protein [Natrinema salaciae]SER49870.1 Uncharacterized conserved membrane protein, UPF0127 family [Natrinema salaciae]
MALEYVWKGLLAIAALSIVGLLLVQAGFVSAPWGADEGEVRVFDGEPDGESAAENETETSTGAADAGDSDGGNASTGSDGTDDSADDGGGDDGDDPKAVVDVEVADTRGERYTGLSDHDSLEPGNGMLFVHDEEQELVYVMRKMDFDIDIIFIDADREITAIHHARAPGPNENGNDIEYAGRGKWVLEVPRGYANETGIEVGDEVEIDLESNRTTVTSVESDALDRVAATVARDGADPGAVAARRVSVRR